MQAWQSTINHWMSLVDDIRYFIYSLLTSPRFHFVTMHRHLSSYKHLSYNATAQKLKFETEPLRTWLYTCIYIYVQFLMTWRYKLLSSIQPGSCYCSRWRQRSYWHCSLEKFLLKSITHWRYHGWLNWGYHFDFIQNPAFEKPKFNLSDEDLRTTPT